MTVLLLDPLRPTMVPVQAVKLLQNPVEFTEEVPVAIRWRLSGMTTPGTDEPTVLISTQRDNPDVLERIALGEDVIEVPVPPGGNLNEAVFIMDRLRSIGGWEATQTHDTLRSYLLEETYELLDAIQSRDSDHIREELGDLLLQVLFHSRIAQDSQDRPFGIDDVAASLVAKLTNRSPHLTDGATGPIDIEAQEQAWEERKALEKVRASCIDGIAMSQPALALAEKVMARALKAGLPDELIPDVLRVVHLDVTRTHHEGTAEDRLRTDVVEFVADVRGAERAAAMDGVLAGQLDAVAWRRYWPAASLPAPQPNPQPDAASNPMNGPPVVTGSNGQANRPDPQ